MLVANEEMKFEITIANLTLDDDHIVVSFNLRGGEEAALRSNHSLHSSQLTMKGR